MPKAIARTVRYHVCLDAGLADGLTRVVCCEGRTASEVIRAAVRDYVRHHPQVELELEPAVKQVARGTAHNPKRASSMTGALVLSVAFPPRGSDGSSE
jgi:metal-responsive CopG/Arc/MetJ family transcriptional regulator